MERSENPVPYRRVTFRELAPEAAFETRMTAGWEIRCSHCHTVLGRLWMPFSGGYILGGTNIHLDPRLVERDGPEQHTGRQLPRYGPPTRVFAKGKGQRTAADGRQGITVHGACWVHCFECNAGQAIDPERFTR